MRYYWCVNCGYNGDFKFDRRKNINCQQCDDEDLTELSDEDWEKNGKEINTRQNGEIRMGKIKEKAQEALENKDQDPPEEKEDDNK